MNYRPWGSVEWALSLTGKKQWTYVGAIGTEERSICAWNLLQSGGHIAHSYLVEIHDVDSDKYKKINEKFLKDRKQQFVLAGGNTNSIFHFHLLDEYFRINNFIRDASKNASSVILDISSLPKRFFFPMLRSLMSMEDIQDVLVTYTSPANYAEDAPLYEDIEPWRVLPGFGSVIEKNPELWIVSIGFLVESLRHYATDNPQDKMKILVPFPAPLSSVRRGWESVLALEQGYTERRFDKFRVDTLDMAAAFDRIISIAGTPRKHVAFAPYGPKPTSVAMCLYAMQCDASVHYAQPTVYHPRYSIGIKNSDPNTAVSAYWIRHGGESLYTI